jgi:hypothetical protein
MDNNSFYINILTIKSNHSFYIEKKIQKIKIMENIGYGSYGYVFLLENKHVIKIFKNSSVTNTILDETNYLLPLKNENRELIFYFKYKNQKKDINYIIELYSIGFIYDKKISKLYNLEEDPYYIILPYCNSFYNKYNFYNKPLINNSNGILFTIKVMQRLLEISQYLEIKYEYINLDFKLNNFMFKMNSGDLNDLIMIDFSIIKSKVKNKKYDFNKRYYIWPQGSSILLENIPSYTITINGLELLFGYNDVSDFPNDKKISNFLKIINNKNKNLYNIFYNGLYLKCNTDFLLKLIKSFIHS